MRKRIDKDYKEGNQEQERNVVEIKTVDIGRGERRKSMKLNVFDAVLCPKYSNEMVIVENCKGREEGKSCPYFKGEGKTGGLFPVLAEINCSYKE